MQKKIIIDASQEGSIGVAVIKNNILNEIDFSIQSKQSLRGNLYLAKVTRVENSLQAAFVEYGGEKNGFLPLSEIHPDYYQIPKEDRDTIVQEIINESKSELSNDEISQEDGDSGETEQSENRNAPNYDEVPTERIRDRKYRISEVIKKDQLVLVQVIKEERGNKGVTLTTYISLAGRYFVYMPNSIKQSGISRRITTVTERRRIREFIQTLNLQNAASLVARTAAGGVDVSDLNKDYEYLTTLWKGIRQRAISVTAPYFVHEEDDILKRAIREYYDKEVSEVIIEGETAHSKLKNFLQDSSYENSVKLYKYNARIPIFSKFGVDNQINDLLSPKAELPSGGYLIIHQTEALVAIDVNSGRGNTESNIEETALKVNLEAAWEVARQIRLRNLSGLIVVDFIDMSRISNRKAVERELKSCLATDRARVHIGRISIFGLLEISRQRTRPSLSEVIGITCQSCGGTGFVRSLDYGATNILHFVDNIACEKTDTKEMFNVIQIIVHPEMLSYILNFKRFSVKTLSNKHKSQILVVPSSDIADRSKFKVNFIVKESVTEATEHFFDDECDMQIASLQHRHYGLHSPKTKENKPRKQGLFSRMFGFIKNI